MPSKQRVAGSSPARGAMKTLCDFPNCNTYSETGHIYCDYHLDIFRRCYKPPPEASPDIYVKARKLFEQEIGPYGEEEITVLS